MQALAGERVEEPGRVADEQPAATGAPRRPGRRAATRPRSRRSRGAVDQSTGSSRGPRDRCQHRADRRLRALAPEPLAATAAEHDPDVDPAARAPARARHSRRRTAIIRASRGRVRLGIGDVERQADARRRAAAGRATPNARATTDRSPSAPTTTPAPDRAAVGQRRAAVVDGPRPSRRSGPRRPACRGEVERGAGRAPTGRARRPARRASRRRRRSAGTRPGRGLDAHRRDRPGDARDRPPRRGRAGAARRPWPAR